MLPVCTNATCFVFPDDVGHIFIAAALDNNFNAMRRSARRIGRIVVVLVSSRKGHTIHIAVQQGNDACDRAGAAACNTVCVTRSGLGIRLG